MGRHYANVANNFVSSVSCKAIARLWLEIVPQRHLVATQTNSLRLGLRAVVGLFGWKWYEGRGDVGDFVRVSLVQDTEHHRTGERPL